MQYAKLFSYGGSQVVRLPKEFTFPNPTKVLIHKCGNKVILEPVLDSWSSLLKGIEKLPPDFDCQRDKSEYSDKKDLF